MNVPNGMPVAPVRTKKLAVMGFCLAGMLPVVMGKSKNLKRKDKEKSRKVQAYLSLGELLPHPNPSP